MRVQVILDLSRTCRAWVQPHSRPQSPRFSWSRGRRNEELWLQPIPEFNSACAEAFNTIAHAQRLILRVGEGREFNSMADLNLQAIILTIILVSRIYFLS